MSPEIKEKLELVLQGAEAMYQALKERPVDTRRLTAAYNIYEKARKEMSIAVGVP